MDTTTSIDTEIISEVTDQTQSLIDHTDEATKIIAKTAAKISAIAVLPVPLLDVAAMTYLQTKMIEKLAILHNKNIESSNVLVISSLLSALISKLLTELLENAAEQVSLSKVLSDGLIKATVSGIITTASGELMHRHFQNGHDIDDLSWSDVKSYIDVQLQSDRLSLSNLSSSIFNSLSKKSII